MKKSLLVIFVFTSFCLSAIAEDISFPAALKNCDKFHITDSASYNGMFYDVTISLDKTKNYCVYKEKIAKTAKEYSLLTCNFDMRLMDTLSQKMQKFNDKYKKELAKKPLFRAKMTSNKEIFEEYIVNPAYCKVTTYPKK